MVNYLDDMVGQVVAALKKKGMWDNLLWTTNSDNVSYDLFSKENNEYSVFMPHCNLFKTTSTQ